MRLQPSLSPHYCCSGLPACLTRLYVLALCCSTRLEKIARSACIFAFPNIILSTRTLDTDNTDFITSFF